MWGPFDSLAWRGLLLFPPAVSVLTEIVCYRPLRCGSGNGEAGCVLGWKAKYCWPSLQNHTQASARELAEHSNTLLCTDITPKQ
jgi:hypothetical protein